MKSIRIKLIFGFICVLQAQTALALEWADLWFTADQQGQRLMNQGEYKLAAEKFTKPENIGTALFMDGEFETAAAVFGRSSKPEASYNRGNALLMLGQYDAAIAAYEKALTMRPDWLEAQQNLNIAILRKQTLAPPDDDFGGTGGQLEADEIVYDSSGRVNKAGSEVVDGSDTQMGEGALREMWLRKVATRPADFLAARFNYQLATREEPQPESGDE